MRTLSTLLFLVLSSFSLKSQTWPAEGAQWYYCASDGFGTYGFEVFSYTNDTLINDTSYAIIRPTLLSYQEALENDQITLVRQSNDTIYRRVDDTEYVFFINGLEVGDVYTTFRSGRFFTNLYSCEPDLQLEVISVENISFEGQEYRMVSLEDINFSSVYEFGVNDPAVHHFIENIGLRFNFPFVSDYGYAGTDAACFGIIPTTTVTWELYQYMDSTVGLSLNLSECNVSGTQNQKTLSFSVYPNPGQGLIHLDGFEGEIQRYEVYDLSGRSIQAGRLRKNQIDVSALHSGIYFLMIHLESGEWGSQKLVIE
jgi:hypothetical protein